jgi:hypothetical protein
VPKDRDSEPPPTRRAPPLPEPDAVPRLLLEVDELRWIAIEEHATRLASLVDGTRTVRELASLCGLELPAAQLILAGLWDRHVVAM